jgi:bifunctional non-homologous end joining protein LigD
MQRSPGLVKDGYMDRDADWASILKKARHLYGVLTPSDLGLVKGRVMPFNDRHWLYEIKQKGYRTLVLSTGTSVVLLTKNGTDLTFAFPELRPELDALPSCAIDCDLVVLAKDGRPDFSRLTSRARHRNWSAINLAATSSPAILVAFDMLALEGRDVRNESIEVRKKLLKTLLIRSNRLQYGSHWNDGIALSKETEDKGYEGVLARRLGSPYLAGACNDWLKFTRDS